MDISPDMVKGSVVPVILSLVCERPMYGYEMVKLVDARTGGKLQWRQGTLYPALHKLESDGLITSDWRSAGGGRSRKYYSITRRGRGELSRRAAEWNVFSTSLNRLLSAGGKA
jgi:PadR family transcriptional regulator, regulatory protein PadR